jgi:hypothetical protein
MVGLPLQTLPLALFHFARLDKERQIFYDIWDDCHSDEYVGGPLGSKALSPKTPSLPLLRSPAQGPLTSGQCVLGLLVDQPGQYLFYSAVTRTPPVGSDYAQRVWTLRGYWSLSQLWPSPIPGGDEEQCWVHTTQRQLYTPPAASYFIPHRCSGASERPASGQITIAFMSMWTSILFCIL